jgi:hypothetical protein
MVHKGVAKAYFKTELLTVMLLLWYATSIFQQQSFVNMNDPHVYTMNWYYLCTGLSIHLYVNRKVDKIICLNQKEFFYLNWAFCKSVSISLPFRVAVIQNTTWNLLFHNYTDLHCVQLTCLIGFDFKCYFSFEKSKPP